MRYEVKPIKICKKYGMRYEIRKLLFEWGFNPPTAKKLHIKYQWYVGQKKLYEVWGSNGVNKKMSVWGYEGRRVWKKIRVWGHEKKKLILQNEKNRYEVWDFLGQ